jgi:hypothetical protein
LAFGSTTKPNWNLWVALGWLNARCASGGGVIHVAAVRVHHRDRPRAHWTAQSVGGGDHDGLLFAQVPSSVVGLVVTSNAAWRFSP